MPPAPPDSPYYRHFHRYSVRLRRPIHHELKNAAARRGMSLMGMTIAALRAYLDEGEVDFDAESEVEPGECPDCGKRLEQAYAYGPDHKPACPRFRPQRGKGRRKKPYPSGPPRRK